MSEQDIRHMLNSITIDSTDCMSELCMMCRNSGTDKAVYTIYPDGHRHPYSIPYSLLFETMRNKPIKFLEIGVYTGASIYAWRSYFKKARLYGFDIDKEAIAKIVPQANTIIDIVDAGKEETLSEGLKKHTADGELFDIIMDDASHSADDHKLLIPIALNYLKQGGILVIEDIYRDIDQNTYMDVIKDVIGKNLITFYTFIVCDHIARYSGHLNNDKLLLMVRS
jgi:SAM-dependent methyltransferase